jgi:hypothetical protein
VGLAPGTGGEVESGTEEEREGLTPGTGGEALSHGVDREVRAVTGATLGTRTVRRASQGGRVELETVEGWMKPHGQEKDRETIIPPGQE